MQLACSGGISFQATGSPLLGLLASEPTALGERHVTQIRTSHRCSERAGRSHVDADAGIRVAGWLAQRLVWWWLGLAGRMGARLGTWMGMASRLGRTAFRRGARILRRRMCRPASCPWPVGTALDFRE